MAVPVSKLARSPDNKLIHGDKISCLIFLTGENRLPLFHCLLPHDLWIAAFGSGDFTSLAFRNWTVGSRGDLRFNNRRKPGALANLIPGAMPFHKLLDSRESNSKLPMPKEKLPLSGSEIDILVDAHTWKEEVGSSFKMVLVIIDVNLPVSKKSKPTRREGKSSLEVDSNLLFFSVGAGDSMDHWQVGATPIDRDVNVVSG